jgi:hypothetical protein
MNIHLVLSLPINKVLGIPKYTTRPGRQKHLDGPPSEI